MIVTVTVNPAVDLTYTVDELVRGGAHRVRSVSHRAGGHGINVARVLHALGSDVVATGLVGGLGGLTLRNELAEAGIPEAFVETSSEPRHTVVVSDADSTTSLWEPGPTLSGTELEALETRLAGLLTDASCLVVSGSVPPGLPANSYARLIALAATAGVPVVLDADGPVLAAALTAEPDVVKPNAEELAVAAGHAVSTVDDVLVAARSLQSAGAGAVVASLGADGLVAVAAGGAWQARPPSTVDGDPSGAGDALVAALARGVAASTTAVDDWPAVLADAVALSAAAVNAPAVGEVDLGAYVRNRAAVRVEPLS